MEAISMRCPNCMGDVIPFDNGAFGRCASCDSVFRLRDGETAGAATADFVDDESDLSDAYFGDRLDSNRSKIDAAVRRFDIDDDDAEEVYCVVDTTIFGSCKVGFAVTVSGLYMVDEDGDSAFLDWDDFDDCRIERDGGKLIIGGHPFIMSTDEARIVARVMRDLQD